MSPAEMGRLTSRLRASWLGDGYNIRNAFRETAVHGLNAELLSSAASNDENPRTPVSPPDLSDAREASCDRAWRWTSRCGCGYSGGSTLTTSSGRRRCVGSGGTCATISCGPSLRDETPPRRSSRETRWAGTRGARTSATRRGAAARSSDAGPRSVCPVRRHGVPRVSENLVSVTADSLLSTTPLDADDGAPSSPRSTARRRAFLTKRFDDSRRVPGFLPSRRRGRLRRRPRTHPHHPLPPTSVAPRRAIRRTRHRTRVPRAPRRGRSGDNSHVDA